MLGLVVSIVGCGGKEIEVVKETNPFTQQVMESRI